MYAKMESQQDEVVIPVGLEKRGQDILIVSLRLPRKYYRDPFFVDSLASSFDIVRSEIKLPGEDELLARPVHYDPKDDRVVFTSLGEFISKYSNKETGSKLGFIFHMSRCGSTLMTQMLATNNRFFVLSEPPIINAVLDPALIISAKEREDLVKSAINALVNCSPHVCEWTFIKFRSWNTFFIDPILKKFPNTHWMFIHRNGLEVLPSVTEKPPGWLRSRKLYSEHFSKVLGVDQPLIHKMSQDEYVARILGKFCYIANYLRTEKSLSVDYKNLTKDFFSNIKELWGIDLTEKEKSDTSTTARLYSKDVSKQIIFKSDSEEKRTRASEYQIELVKRFVESERLKLIQEV